MLADDLDSFAMLPFVDGTPVLETVLSETPIARVELSPSERSELLAFARLAGVVATAHSCTPDELSGVLRESGWECHPGFRVGDPVTGLIAVACRHQESGRLAVAFGVVPESHSQIRELQFGMSGEVPSATAQAGVLALLARTCHGADVTLVGMGASGSMASYAGFTAGLPVVTINATAPEPGVVTALALSGRLTATAAPTQRHLLTSGSLPKQMFGRCLVFDRGSTPLMALETGEHPCELSAEPNSPVQV